MRTKFQRTSKNNRLYKKRARLYGGSDGTVKTETLLTFLNKEFCHYCSKFISESKRTIDHLTPLIRNGMHSKDNLTMACKNCNTRKGCLTSEEFFIVKNEPTKLKRVVNRVSKVIETKVSLMKALTTVQNLS